MSLADDIIQDARSYAEDTYEDAAKLVNDAARRILTTIPQEPEVIIPEAYIDPLSYTLPQDFNDSFTTPIKNVVAPNIIEAQLPEAMEDTGDVPEFDGNLWSGSPPSFNIPNFNGIAPNISAVDIPDAPDYVPIPYPELEDVIVPKFDGISIPSFDAEMLTGLPDPVTDIAKDYKDIYKEALPEMKAFIDAGVQEFLTTYAPEYENNRTRLTDRINQTYDGGTGLSTTFEQNLYDRGRARAEQEQIRITDEVQKGAAKRGHFVPPSAVTSALVQAQSSAAVANAQYASETTIERAKLELDHLQFVMQLSNSMRDTALQMSMQQANILLQVNSQALDNAKNTANILTEMYNLDIKRFEVSMQYYKIQADVYETEFKAALADLEIFRVEAEVAKLTNDINQSEVDIYVARLNAQKIEAEIFGIEVQAIETQVRAESAAVDAYGKEVQAYTAKVNAKSAEFEAYSAALSGNKIQADIYAVKVQAYKVNVDAAKAVVDSSVASTQAITAYNRNLIEQFKAELSAYETDIQAESTRFDSSSKAYIATLSSFKAELDAKKAALLGQVEGSKLDVNSALQDYRAQASFASDRAKIRNTSSEAQANVALSGAAVYTNIAGAAIASQNSMVQVVESE
ncbi:MAG: hypothetical protein DRQ47_02670 [Gammaproteobacteria bacterium]|nr:MAG: hypothetical protein DRQ47_02670 [Gammaproteobacteria bacterium]